MSPSKHLRERFTDGGLATASGPKIIVLCYERLERDLSGAIEAIASVDIARTHDLLCHAQDIVHELRCMLQLDAWEHAPQLSSIYRYIHDLLVQANVRKDAVLVTEARGMLADLGEAFRAAAAQLAVTPVPSPAPTMSSPAFATAGTAAPRAFSALA
jgi:flagellar secretion chaperone FliS